MKKIFLPLALLFLAACSIEKDDLNESQIQFSELNAIVEIDGCEPESYNFENVGKIEVTNDTETLYITIASTAENFVLINSKLHIANSPSSFPTVGQGNLPTVNMKYYKDFEPNVKSFTFEFPLVDLDECVYIASHSTFSNGKKSVTSWVGDINVKHGNWSYFQYCIQECIPACEDPIYTGPSELTGSINYTDARDAADYDVATKFFSDLILSTGKYLGDDNQLAVYTNYSPDIYALVAEFKSRNEANLTDDIKTTYSYGTGECAGTIDLTLTIIDDRN